ncbi:vitamin K epoxide reductase complex subunit 1-like protein 1 [Ischnura elegans]|uniref:vitamin K epoxide reductase complex subunit 1-like protein 1 n=1 Tax=Ischnura elegans TaxID=197161 RepID=UPI001ED8957D|nr:vitamin K epoxide reductase complex subunit 1-like protein 1 [Ischnura elegans]
MPKMTDLSKGMIFFCFCGILLSYYAYIVETKKEEDENYEAMCDISEHMSCSKAFSSRFGKGFGVIGSVLGENSVLNQPNSIYGILFYSIVGVLATLESAAASRILFWVCLFSNLASIYLAYILAFILHDFCVVCISTYIVNAVITFLAYFRFKRHVSQHVKAN